MPAGEQDYAALRDKLCRIIGCTPNDVIRFSDEPR